MFARRTKHFALAAIFMSLTGSLWAQVSLDGKSIDPFKTAGDRPVVLLFVTTECPVSNRYAPEIQRLASKFSSRAVFWLVYPDPHDTPEKIATHLKEYRYHVKAVRDVSFTLAHRSHARVTPEAAVFDRQVRLVYHGRIDDRFIRFGVEKRAATQHDLEEAVQAVLDGKPVQAAETPPVGCFIADLER